jgi:radical SAM protein with 4Fe4S-binding SPASM domain
MYFNSPLELFWNVTSKCNLNCNFCLWGATLNNSAELNYTQKLKILNQIIENKILKVYLTGGEPFCEPHIFDYINLLKKNNIFIEITTNATLINENKIRKLKEYNVDDIQVSINASYRELNDKIMGKSFNKILENIKLILKYEIDIHTKITVIRKNINNIPDLIDLLYKIGIRRFVIAEFTRMGYGLQFEKDLVSDIKSLQNLQLQIDRLSERFSDAHIRFSSKTLEDIKNGHVARCTMGDEKAHSALLYWDGNLYPCTPSTIFDIKNNVIEIGLKNAWQNLTSFQKYIDPEKLQGPCSKCELKFYCKGGCRAFAKMVTGSVFGSDLSCPKIRRS